MYLDKRSESLKLIQHLRNEAHRFGITHHRNKRSSNTFKTSLDKIDGIGEKTKTDKWGMECWSPLATTCIKSILDKETNIYIDNKMLERINTWIDWSGFEANHIKMTQHQINLKWHKLMMEEANRMSEETGITIEECLANKFAEETGGSFEDGLKIANKMVESNLPIHKNVAHYV